jgi:predicted permease
MQAIFAVTFPFFALVLCGWLAARRRVLPEAAIPGLNIFVLYFALPCLLYRFGASTPLARLADPAVLGVYALAGLAIVGLTIALTLSPRVHLKDAAFGALVAAFPNLGFMGVPMLLALLGPAAAAPLSAAIMFDVVVTSSLCVGLAQVHDAAGRGRGATLANALRGAAKNPLPWAIVLGALASWSGFALPGPIEQVVKMLGDAATPVALFSIGSVLWRAGQHAHTRTPPALYLPVALIKLVVHPLLVYALGLAAMALGAPLSRESFQVLVLAAALPSASNVSLMAERYEADNGRVARIIMASTVLAFPSFSLLAGWLKS